MLEIGVRPWGKYYVLADEPNIKLKWIEVLPGQRLSYQYHYKRQEAWTIVQGTAKIILDGVDKIYKYRETALRLLSAKHRIQNTYRPRKIEVSKFWNCNCIQKFGYRS